MQYILADCYMNRNTPISQLFTYIIEICRLNKLPYTVYVDMFRDGILSQISGNETIERFLQKWDQYMLALHDTYSNARILTFYDIIRSLQQSHSDIEVPLIARYESLNNHEHHTEDEEEVTQEPNNTENNMMMHKAEAWVWLAGFITARVFSS